MWTTYSTFVAYDVRFRTDDVVNTVFKVLQIGVLVMIGVMQLLLGALTPRSRLHQQSVWARRRARLRCRL